MTTSIEAAGVVCSVCRRRCRRPLSGGRWLVEWRAGDGSVFEMEAGITDSECEAFARIPSSPLPGSYRKLLEVSASGRRVVWQRSDARNIAVHRREFLARFVGGLLRYFAAEDEERTRGLLSVPVMDLEANDVERALAVWEIRTLLDLERRGVRPPDKVAAAGERFATTLALLPAGSAVRTRAPSYEAWDFARNQVGPWGEIAAELADNYSTLATEVEAEARTVAFAWREIRPELARAYECVRDDLGAVSVLAHGIGFRRVRTTRRKVRVAGWRRTSTGRVLSAVERSSALHVAGEDDSAIIARKLLGGGDRD